MNAIEINDLKKTYADGTEALKGVSMNIEEGDFFALLGANGAGKTTIIGILTGLVNKTGGTANVFGIDIDKDPDKTKEYIGVVPQEFNFSIFETVIDIVVTQAGYYGIPRKKALARAETVLKALDLWEKKDTKSMQLSGGMKRRLMIARALMHEPKLLILDEPTAGVDVELRHGMWKYLRELNASGVTILLTTHYLEEAEQLCRNVAIIRKGEIIKQGRVKELLQSVDTETYAIDINKPADATFPEGWNVETVDEDTIEVDATPEKPIADFILALKQQGIVAKSIKPTENRLERLFRNVTNENV